MRNANQFLKWLYGPEGGGSHIRPQHVLRFVTDIPNEAGETFWQVITETWSDFDLIPHAEFEIQFARFSATAPGVGDSQRLCLFRGQDAGAPIGLSWTSCAEVAARFAHGHRGMFNKEPVILKILAEPRDIAFTCDDREESEFVLLSRPALYQVVGAA
jgi:hypothetical protein